MRRYFLPASLLFLISVNLIMFRELNFIKRESFEFRSIAESVSYELKSLKEQRDRDYEYDSRFYQLFEEGSRIQNEGIKGVYEGLNKLITINGFERVSRYRAFADKQEIGDKEILTFLKNIPYLGRKIEDAIGYNYDEKQIVDFLVRARIIETDKQGNIRLNLYMVNAEDAGEEKP